jgi:membrane protease YdiL (CAAX protease family)
MHASRWALLRRFIIFSCLAVVSLLAWFSLSWPRFALLSLKIDRSSALALAGQELARQYQRQPGAFRSAVVFRHESYADRFLQKALGINAFNAYALEHGLDFYHWSVRFFVPGEKEEFRIAIIPRSGKVISRTHVIDEAQQRQDSGVDSARALIVDFFSARGVDFSRYELKDEVRTAFDRRVEYAFSWRKKGADVTWDDAPDSGTGKILIGGAVSGEEVLAFSEGRVEVPDRFGRYLDAQEETGRNFSLLFNIVYFALLVVVINLVMRSRLQLALRASSRFLSVLAWVLCAGLMSGVFNFADALIFSYQTSQAYEPFLFRSAASTLMSVVFTAFGFVFFALAGEGECSRSSAGKGRSFLWFLRSSFLTRQTAGKIFLGYVLACGMLGLQALLFFFGEQYCGVWQEQQGITSFSTALWPWLAALMLAFRAALTEEVVFRVFLLNWIANRTGNTILAVIVSSLVWGFGHAGYQIYPMWFRGVEVSVIGLLLAWVYLRAGLVPVLVAHFLFDVFWNGAGSLLNPAAPLYFWSTCGVLAIPLLWAVVAFALARSGELRPLNWTLAPEQQLNLEILSSYLEKLDVDSRQTQALRQRLADQSWDPAVIEQAFAARQENSSKA